MYTCQNDLITSIYNSSPELKFCNKFDGDSPLWDYTRHKHPYIELIYHLNGNVRRKINDDFLQNANLFDIILYPVNYWHQDDPHIVNSMNLRNNEVYCIWIELPQITFREAIKVQDQNGFLEHLFSSIYLESQKPFPMHELVCLQIKTLLLQILELENENPNTPINRILQYLNLHSAENISLDKLAKQEHISKSGLTKQFKQKTGTTMITYLHNIRLKKAKRLLAATHKSVEEIALEVGFDSPKYFYRLFKEHENISPNAYRRLYLTEHVDSVIT